MLHRLGIGDIHWDVRITGFYFRLRWGRTIEVVDDIQEMCFQAIVAIAAIAGNCRTLSTTLDFENTKSTHLPPPTDRETFRTQQEKKQSRCNHAEYEFTTLGSKWDSCVSVDVPRIEQARWVGFDMFCRRIFAGDL